MAKRVLDRRRAQMRARRRLLVGLLAGASVAIVLGTVAILLPNFMGRPAATQPEHRRSEAQATSQCEAGDGALSDCPERGQFLEALKAYRNEQKPRLEEVSLARWASLEAGEIADMERQAIEHFDQGRYPEALSSITKARENALVQIERAEQRFADSMAAANSALAAGDASIAQAAVDSALLINPKDDSANQLAKRIDVLPRVLELLELARVARAENRTGKERSALERAIELDPARTELTKRIRQLRGSQSQQRYADAVRAAERALSSGRLPEARKHAEAAQKLSPGTSMEFLFSRIEALEASNAVARGLAEAKRHRQADQWRRAAQAYENVLAINGQHPGAVAGLKEARSIQALADTISTYLGAPLRLGTPAIAADARASLNQARALLDVSPGLRDKATELTRLLELADRKVPVTVHSDGKTTVSVRRVGMVGKHREKVIQLGPGEYLFEGKRNGYQSIVVPVKIPLEQDAVAVTLVCDEPV